jgi:hypothetical protein
MIQTAETLSKHQIIELLAKDKFIKDCVYNITRGNYLKEDLFQELMLHLCEQSEDKIKHLHQNQILNFHCLKYLTNQYKSQDSEWFRQETRFKIRHKKIGDFAHYSDGVLLTEDEINKKPTIKQDLEMLCPTIRHYIQNSLHWYDRLLFLKYVDEGKSIREISKEIGIPANTIWYTINKAKNEIRQFIRDNKLKDKI